MLLIPCFWRKWGLPLEGGEIMFPRNFWDQILKFFNFLFPLSLFSNSFPITPSPDRGNKSACLATSLTLSIPCPWSWLYVWWNGHRPQSCLTDLTPLMTLRKCPWLSVKLHLNSGSPVSTLEVMMLMPAERIMKSQCPYEQLTGLEKLTSQFPSSVEWINFLNV